MFLVSLCALCCFTSFEVVLAVVGVLWFVAIFSTASGYVQSFLLVLGCLGPMCLLVLGCFYMVMFFIVIFFQVVLGCSGCLGSSDSFRLYRDAKSLLCCFTLFYVLLDRSGLLKSFKLFYSVSGCFAMCQRCLRPLF